MAVIVFALMTAGFVTLAAIGDASDLGRAIVFTPVTISMTVLAAGQLRARRPSLGRVRLVPQGVTAMATAVPQRRLQDLCLMAPITVGLVIGVAGLGIGLSRGELSPLITGLLLVPLLGWAAVDTGRRLKHPAQIVLTPDEIVMEERGRRTAVRWRDVIGFRLGGNPRATLSVLVVMPDTAFGWRPRWWAPSRRPPWRPIEFEPERYAIDPVALLATLEFYLAHPTLRPELADGRMLERLRRGDITRDAVGPGPGVRTA